jgi:hypothetical protein
MGKIYLKGSAKTIAGQHGKFLSLSIKLEDLQKYVTEKGYVNLCVFKRKETSQYGDTHNITANEYFIHSDEVDVDAPPVDAVMA